jgi:1,4-alpha-glucan branching enzyme
MPGDDWQKFANLRLLYGYQWSLPGKKLLFMGGEIGVWKEWNHDDVLDWDLCNHERHAGLQRWVRDLNAIYRRYPALYRRDVEPGGFEWVIGDDKDNSTLVYLRLGEPGDAPVLVACNLTPVPRHGYTVGVPAAGRWSEVLNGDAADYGGSGIGNLGGVLASPAPWRHLPASITLSLPPLGVVYMVLDG